MKIYFYINIIEARAMSHKLLLRVCPDCGMAHCVCSQHFRGFCPRCFTELRQVKTEVEETREKKIHHLLLHICPKCGFAHCVCRTHFTGKCPHCSAPETLLDVSAEKVIFKWRKA